MDSPPLSSRAQRLFDESGLGVAREPIDAVLVSDLLRGHYGLSGVLEPLATEKDDTFRLRNGPVSHLVKVSSPDEAQDTVALQTGAMRFLETMAPELPVQRVCLTLDRRDSVLVETDDRSTRVLRVFTFVDGDVWAQIDPTDEQLAKMGSMLGRIDVELEAFAHPADRRELVWDLRHFHELSGLVEHASTAEHGLAVKRVFELFEAIVVPRLDELDAQVIHGDFSPYNVVVDDDDDDFVVGVIDFGDTMRSAAIFDPAVAMANILGRAPDEPWRHARAFVVGYERVRPIDDRELPLLPVAALARLTLRALITNWRAVRVPDRRDYLLAHAKDDWVNVERALAVPVADVVTQLRAAPRGQG